MEPSEWSSEEKEPFDRFDQLTAGKLPPPLKLGRTGRVEGEPDAASGYSLGIIERDASGKTYQKGTAKRR